MPTTKSTVQEVLVKTVQATLDVTLQVKFYRIKEPENESAESLKWSVSPQSCTMRETLHRQQELTIFSRNPQMMNVWEEKKI